MRTNQSASPSGAGRSSRPEDIAVNMDHAPEGTQAAAIAGIQRGLRGMYEGTGQDAEEAFASLERELGIVDG